MNPGSMTEGGRWSPTDAPPATFVNRSAVNRNELNESPSIVMTASIQSRALDFVLIHKKRTGCFRNRAFREIVFRAVRTDRAQSFSILPVHYLDTKRYRLPNGVVK